MKNVPNYITILRIFAAVSLLFVKPFSALFFFFYLICGISDVLDGYIARKMNASSNLGQILDSISDLIFISIVLLISIPIIKLPSLIIYWIVVIVVVRFFSIIIGFLRFQQFAFLHTFANKATGIIIFFFPFIFFIFGIEITTTIICCMASISAIEELLINLTSKTLHRDRNSIFSK
jgi:CDP-diacylglycerol--glycerol-3-phosphate 3-phosphatidyltransferase